MPLVYPLQPVPRNHSTWVWQQGVPMLSLMPGLPLRTQSCWAAHSCGISRAGSQPRSQLLEPVLSVLAKPMEWPLLESKTALSCAGSGGPTRGRVRQGGPGINRGLCALRLPGTGEAAADVAEEDDVKSLQVQRQRIAEGLKALSPAEMKALRAHAHRLGDALVSQQVGKWGVTEALVAALDAALEANEILKVRVSQNMPEEVEDLVLALEQRLHARVVGRIGRALVLYRPSLTPPSRSHRRRRGTRGRGRGAAEDTLD